MMIIHRIYLNHHRQTPQILDSVVWLYRVVEQSNVKQSESHFRKKLDVLQYAFCLLYVIAR